MLRARFLASGDVDAATTVAALTHRLGATVGLPVARDVTHLDSFDWRLWHAGGRLTLVEEAGRRRLSWLAAADAASHLVPCDGAVRLAADLPAGGLRDAVAPLLGVRALLELGAARHLVHPLRVADRDGNTAARLWLEEVAILGDGVEVAERVLALRAELVPGEGPGLEAVLAALDDGWATTAEPDDLERAARARGRRPGDYSSKLQLELDGAAPAGAALRHILTVLLDTLVANVDGALADLDPEFLHDLRVATRRSRAALSQLKGVLPAAEVAPFAAELRWLQGLTGEGRDLDVFQLEMTGHLAALPTSTAADLEPLLAEIAAARRAAHAELAAGLRSPRFAALLEGWSAYLEGPPSGASASDAGRPIAEVAARRVRRAYGRILRHGAALPADPPAADLHRIRIDAKKLRYLLEFFRSLYPAKRAAALIARLRELQDVLGGGNDMQVQLRRLRELAARLMAAGRADAATFMAMGRLAALLEQRREAYRADFHRRFDPFAGPETRREMAALTGG